MPDPNLELAQRILRGEETDGRGSRLYPSDIRTLAQAYIDLSLAKSFDEAAIETLRAQRDEAEAKLDTVRKLHREDVGSCGTCVNETWPCPTIKAVDDE